MPAKHAEAITWLQLADSKLTAQAYLTSEIAAHLLKGGCTTHSCFNISISCHESSVYNISKHSNLAELIHSTDLVIWDEAPTA